MQLYQVDAFTAEPFKGNPAGVCLVDRFPQSSVMQAIAAEMNLSETAFVETGGSVFPIRYFTPTCEVPLCGHATLASAHILYQSGRVALNESFIFNAPQSELSVSADGDWIKMIFPVYSLEAVGDRRPFDAMLNTTSLEARRSRNGWVVVRVGSEKEVMDARADFEAIRAGKMADLLAVTAPSSSPKYDFVVRVFCNPDCGIAEDPVTGVASCILAPYWCAVLHKQCLIARQLSHRTGELMMTLIDDKVEISGQAVTVFNIDIIRPA